MNKSYNVRALENNLKLVFRSGNIEKLNKPTYNFITLYMGFIAHYDVYGFRAEYKDLWLLADTLPSGEGWADTERNLEYADRWENDPYFTKLYGRSYVVSVAAGIRALVNVARSYLTR